MTDRVEVAAGILGARARRQAPLGALTTYRVGGPAALFLDAEGDDDLELAGRAVRASGVEVLVVGRGSNLLVADTGFPGLAIRLGPAYERVEVAGSVVRAGGATPLPALARRTATAGLRGLEWAVGVPGSVGGGVRMNAGGHGSDVAATLQEVRVLDLAGGQDARVPAADLDLSYRHSAVRATHVVAEAVFGLEVGDAAAAQRLVADIVRWRRLHQPGGQNAGSVFTNPAGDSAGRLIDAAGCRGLRRRTAVVSEKHANFVQADPGGRAGDVLDLMQEVRARVEAHAGIALRAEVRLVGFANPRLEVEG